MTSTPNQPTPDDGTYVQFTIVLDTRQDGRPTDVDELQTLELTLERAVQTAGIGQYGGHGTSFGTRDIFLYGSDAQALAAVALPIVYAWGPAAGSMITVGDVVLQIAELKPDHFDRLASQPKRKPTGRDPGAGNSRAVRRRVERETTAGKRSINGGTGNTAKQHPIPDIKPQWGNAHPLPIAMSAAAPLRILQLEQMSDAAFENTWQRWRDEGLNSEAFASEATIHRGAKPGQSAEAFNVMAKVIAVLSFAPGGVEVFGVRWVGRRSSPAWAAFNLADEEGSPAASIADAFKALDELGAPCQTSDRKAA